MDNVAVFIAQDLKFDMVRTFDVLFDEDAAVAEGRQRFPCRDFHILAQLLVGADDPESASPAAGAGLDHNRVIDPMGEFQGLVDAGDAAFGSGDNREARLLGDLTSFDLAAHEVNRLWRRTDEGNPGGVAESGEFRVFREEPVPGVDRVGADALRDLHDLFAVQEAFDGARPYEVGLVGFFDVDAGGIGFGIDRRCRDIEFAAAADDAHGDFATVGNKDLPKHAGLAGGSEPELTSDSPPKKIA